MKITRIEATLPPKKLHVAAYCRVSTAFSEQEDSLETQQTVYERYIRANPLWDLTGIYTDIRSGLSAEKRLGFMRMIADALAGRIDLILCKSISRFSRNIVECQRYTSMLRARNITVVFEKENLRTDEPTSSLIFSLMCAIAQDESRSISENIHTANRHRVAAGVYTPHRNHMLGYTVRNGKLTPDENAWIIRHIFHRYAEGLGAAAICRELNDRGAICLRSGKPLAIQNIQHILRNESYVGDKLLQKQPPRNYLTKKPDPSLPFTPHYLSNDHEAIIERDVWNAVQQRLAQGKVASPPSHL